MITILEGPDACGKTTFALDAAWDDHRYLHQGRYLTRNVLHETMLTLEHQLHGPQGWPNLICDRLHYGEDVYGPIVRGRSDLQPYMKRMLLRFLLSQQGGVIVTLTSLENATQSWRRTKEERHEYVEDDSSYVRIWKRYIELVRTGYFDLPMVVYDYTTNVRVKDVREQLDAVRPPLNRGPGVGVFAQGVTLMVGEQFNPTNIGYRYPFIGSQSGRWLCDELDRVGVNEHQLYWVNALNLDGTELDPSFIEQLQPSRVVALGKVAERWLQKYHIQYNPLPHPQFWKRFKNGQPYPLKEALG